MNRIERRKIETKTGIGKLFKSELEIDTVEYLIDVYQEVHIIETSSGREEIKGVKDEILEFRVRDLR